LPVQLFLVVDQVKAFGPQHPEWQTQEPFASLLKGDAKGVAAGGERGLVELIMSTDAGMPSSAPMLLSVIRAITPAWATWCCSPRP